MNITTAAELDALPVGSVVRSEVGTIACRYDETRGVVFGDERPFPWHVIARPATVLYRPDQQPTAQPTVEQVADAIHGAFDLDTPEDDEPCYCDLDTLNEAAVAVLALLPGHTEAEVKAEAWDEGWAARADRKHLKVGECVPAPPHINPYRADRVKAGR